MTLEKLDDLVYAEQELYGLDGVDFDHPGRHRLDGMMSLATQKDVEVTVQLDEAHQLGEDSLVTYLLEVVDDEDELAVSRRSRKR